MLQALDRNEVSIVEVPADHPILMDFVLDLTIRFEITDHDIANEFFLALFPNTSKTDSFNIGETDTQFFDTHDILLFG